mmetsp:Transcript_4706/g.9899  ORF Transcript_4706/g.9899 Transcript_4706/m.9899 type:complete len:325 (+) Transcript_4706:62-1036(+)
MSKKYICTNCSVPTPSLYKVYSTPGSIQLTTCKYCGHDVDPYIERELILVIIDCVLHRPEAFRHVLYNRDTFGGIKLGRITCGDELKKKENNCLKGNDTIGEFDQSSNFHCWGNLVRFTTIASILKAYIGYVVFESDEEAMSIGNSMQVPVANETLNASFAGVFTLFVGDVIFVTTVFLSATLLLQNVPKTETIGGKNVSTTITESATKIDEAYFVMRIYAASTFPSFFHIVTIFALIWEKSLTVCSLGTLFVLSLQRIGIATVVNESIVKVSRKIKANQSSNSIAIDWLIQSLPFLFGVISRTFIMHMINSLVENPRNAASPK